MFLLQDEDAPLVREEEDLFIIDQSAQDFLVVKKAEYVGYWHRLQREKELLFVPSMRTGDAASEQSPRENSQPRRTVTQREQSARENRQPGRTVSQREQSPREDSHPERTVTQGEQSPRENSHPERTVTQGEHLKLHQSISS